MKIEKNKIIEGPYIPKLPRSYSVEEILAAGGATAFASKMGQKPENIEKALEALPDDSFLTDEEFNEALAILKENK